LAYRLCGFKNDLNKFQLCKGIMYKSYYNLKFENSSSEFVSYVGPRLNLAGSLNIVFGVVSSSIASSSPDFKLIPEQS